MKFVKEEPPAGNGVKVYPNPVIDILKIELFGETARTFKIELITISGTIVRSEKIIFPDQFWNIQEVNVESLSKGLYFVRVISDDGLINRTFKIDKM
jgi:Secretion system C-terminal sorting domain